MPIRFDKEFLSQFSKNDLKKIIKYRKTAVFFSIIGIILNIIVYIAVTFLGFIYWGPEGYFYDYLVRLNLINLSYFITWIAIYLTSFCILLNVMLMRLTLNPFMIILKNRKDLKIKNLDETLHNFYLSIRYRIYGQLLLIAIMIIELNYYPRNTQLFYPYVGCNLDSGICVISETVFLMYILAMTSFIIITVGVYLLIIFINIKEINVIKGILAPVIEVEKKKEDEEKKEWKTLSIEKRRQIRIQEIKEEHELARLKKQQHIRGKFDDMLKHEQFGSKGFRYVSKQDKTIEKKEIKDKKKKKREDEFDFT